ncbi:hypothetical protein [Botrimarina sp.]|uniref:hypothetical protein n=1 Tax=Botrimarina sp. TaxID=2795802 RepID=UPI0032EBD7FD
MNATRKLLTLAVALGAFATGAAYGQNASEPSAPRALPKPGAAPIESATPAKAAVSQLLSAARAALAEGDTTRAERLAAQASQLGVPETAFAENEDTPSKLALQLQAARYRLDPAVVTAGGASPAGQAAMASQALHLSDGGRGAVQPAAALVGPAVGGQPTRVAQLPLPAERVEPARSVPALVLLSEGEQKLRDGDLDGALERFRAADRNRAGLDAGAARRLDDHLRMLAGGDSAAPDRAIDASMIDAADADQQVLARQLAAAVGRAQVDSRELRESAPREALEMLEKTKAEITASGVAKDYRDQLVRRVDRSISETKRYIEDNRAQIELDEQNAAVLAEIDRENAVEARTRSKISEDIERFNDLMDERRVAEAEVVAKRLKELAPDDPTVQQLWQYSKFARRNLLNDEMLDEKDEALWNMRYNIETSAIPLVGDDRNLVYGKDWDQIKDRPGLGSGRGRMSPREVEIQQKLKTPVRVSYTDRPLAEVMEGLSRMADVPIYLDARGLSQEGVSSDTPVTINIPADISLESALNLILDDLNLGHVVKDEVLKITSSSLRDGDVYEKVYYVADLVIPIPNFVPSSNTGMQGLINDALAVASNSTWGGAAPGAMGLAGAKPGMGDPSANPNVLAQNFSPSGQLGGGVLNTNPAGPGGAAAADFDSLIELITSTIASDTWAENGGGTAEIRPFPTNLSLVISQTQSVHEEIADLLEQLRRLQDLQVTIEVRFIQLNDNFFERIGIDFDMNINDNILGTDELVQTGAPAAVAGSFQQEVVNSPDGIARTRRGATVGVEAPIAGSLATVTADLDLPFRQGSFPVAQPQFGGFSPDSAATFGFAILSDIEAYFLINAAQGDSRTNVLNAPKVTLFNGQQAFVADQSQRPFVLSVIPVVGEFAAAQQPVIVVLSEGTFTSIQAVVSEDRRYVRMTVIPFFSEIGQVETFTFDGSTTTTTSSSSDATDSDDDGTNESASGSQNQQRTIAGTTVQQPTFQQISVSTTVSVPDGGTVLLGGIKRLSEGRREFGVPLLSKLPYINRLFRNVGIGRETDSLMLMVTPRIIIQEEEEARQGLAGG